MWFVVCRFHLLQRRADFVGIRQEAYIASYSQSPNFPGIFHHVVSQGLPCISLWALPRWYAMSWCAADLTDKACWEADCGINRSRFSYSWHPFSSAASSPLSLHHVLCLSVSLPVLSPGGVGAGLLCPLWVGRVFKLHCSWQAWGKPTATTPTNTRDRTEAMFFQSCYFIHVTLLSRHSFSSGLLLLCQVKKKT